MVGANMTNKSWSSLICVGLLFGILEVSATEEAAKIDVSSGKIHSAGKKSDLLIPHLRMGRSNHKNPKALETLKILEKELAMQQLENLQNQHLISVKPLAKPRSVTHEKQQNPIYVGSEYLLPYPRPGRDVFENTKRQFAIVSSPRVGKSTSKAQNEDDSLMLPLARFGRSTTTDSDGTDIQGQFITPYPRLGKRNYYDSMLLQRLGRSSDFLTPYPRIGKRIYSNSVLLPYQRLTRSDQYITPYPRLGKRDTSDTMLLPYPRIGRDEDSEYITPYPRLGKRSYTDDLMIPYPRMGKRYSEDTLLPYPRLGKRYNDDTMIPFPRIGRGKQPSLGSEEEDPMLYITPYPRLGKRFEQIDLTRQMYANLLNTLSDGSVDTLIPYMRPGRSEYDEYQDDNATNSDLDFAEDESDTVTMIPNFRFGRSQAKAESHIRRRRSLDFGERNVLIPFTRMDPRSSNPDYTIFNAFAAKHVKDSNDNNNEDNNKDIASESEDSPYMLPYLRPGRSNQHSYSSHGSSKHPNEKLVSHWSKDQNEESSSNDLYLLPYPRPGRSYH